MDRIDALGDERNERLDHLTGEVLGDRPDPELQQIVREVAAVVRAPIALVSLVLRRTQVFRAHHGLPSDLEASRATDRDVSFCQFVVRDERCFLVSDARADERVPKDLVERYGIRAYLGQPIEIGGTVVGSLCAIDTKPREFDAATIEALERLARRASRRLGELAKATRVRLDLVEAASAPLFAELRNVLSVLGPSVSLARTAAAETAALVRLADLGVDRARVDGALHQARASVGDLGEHVEEIRLATERLSTGLASLERLLSSGLGVACSLDEAVSAALHLALHQTKVVGGVRLTGLEATRLGVPRAVAVAVVAATLAGLADAMGAAGARGGIDARATLGPEHVLLGFRAAGLGGASLDAVADTVRLLAADLPGVACSTADGELLLRFPSFGDA